MKKLIPSETAEQQAFVHWLRLKRIIFTAMPNEGKRSIVAGARMKREGLQAGFPDLLILSLPKQLREQGYRGVAIEMKAVNGRIRKEQQEWLNILESIGWSAHVCKGCHEAVRLMESLGYGQTTEETMP